MANPLLHTASLPCGYTVTFSWVGGDMGVEWSPEFPRIRSKRQWKKFLAAYEAERAEFMRTVATMIGKPVMVFDLNGHMSVEQPGAIQ